jgi:hypothetical protein
LAEQDANIGFLAEYCGDGSWFVDKISNDGSIIQTLSKSLTSTRQNVNLGLTLDGTTLTISIDQEEHQVTGLTLIQPVKVAITYFTDVVGYTITTTNFSYVTPSS